MYKLYLFKTDGHIAKYDYVKKPTFEDMYPLLDTDLIEMSTAKMPEYSNRKDGYTDIYFDEEFLIKFNQRIVNQIVTKGWREWLSATGRVVLPPGVICGNVCVIKKENDEAA